MSPRLWSKEFIVSIAVNLFMSSVFYLLLTSMATYAVAEFQASETLAGLAASGFIIGAVAGRLFSGKFLDFVGRRRLLVISMAVYVVASIAYIPVSHLWVLIVLRIIHGIAFGAGNTALVAAVQAIIPTPRRAEGNGYFGTATTLSTAMGPFLAVWLSQHVGFDAIFLLSTVCALGALVASRFFTVPEREPSDEERQHLWKMHLTSFIEPKALKIGLIMLISGTAYASVLSFLAIHTEKLFIPNASSAFFIAYSVATLFARLFAGRLQDQFGDNIVAIPVFLLFTVGMVLVGLSTTTFLMVVAGVTLGLGFGTTIPMMQAMLINQTPAARLGVATSTFFLMLDIGSGVGPVILGSIGEQTGFPTMFIIAALFALVAGVLYVLFHGRHVRRPQP